MKIGRDKVRRERIDDKYSVTEDGLVWSGELPLEPINGEGVNLHGKRFKVAYLVARAFVPNQECRKWVRHKNGDRTDNRASNLEWSDEKEEERRGRKPTARWISAVDDNFNVVGNWPNVMEAAKAVGVAPGAIRACLARRRRRAGGFMWVDL